MNLPKNVEKIINILNKNGFEAFIVGGCVRDSIIGRPPGDWDITTSANPKEVKALFEHTYDTGIKHGTVSVLMDNESYEVTTYRIDGAYKNFRSPESVRFTTYLNEDLLRRDFTINAIAYHPSIGFKDPFNGTIDIKNKIIRGVGNPTARFREDALRILRALRFSVQLDFEIEEETYGAIIKNASLLSNISVERIREEVEKILMADNACRIRLLFETGILEYVWGKLYRSVAGKEHKITNCLDKTDKCLVLRWVIFLRYLEADDLKEFLKYLKFDNKTLNKVITISGSIHEKLEADKYCLRKKASEIGMLNLIYVIKAKKIITNEDYTDRALEMLVQIIENDDPITIKNLDITGNDLMEMGIEKGKEIGRILNMLLDMVHKNINLNKKDILKEIVLKLI